MFCDDFDLCEVCASLADSHAADHPMVRWADPSLKGPLFSAGTPVTTEAPCVKCGRTQFARDPWRCVDCANPAESDAAAGDVLLCQPCELRGGHGHSGHRLMMRR